MSGGRGCLGPLRCSCPRSAARAGTAPALVGSLGTPAPGVRLRRFVRPHVEPERRVVVGHEADICGCPGRPAIQSKREVEESGRIAAGEEEYDTGDDDEEPDELTSFSWTFACRAWMASRRHDGC